MHGGKGSGAPAGNQNSVTSGKHTAKATALRAYVSMLLWMIGRDARREPRKQFSGLEADELRALTRGRLRRT